MARSDPTLQYSKKLCEEAGVLRHESRIALAESKQALANSRRTAEVIQRRRKSKFK